MDVEALTTRIRAVLTELDEGKAKDLATFLYERGLRNERRLRLVTENDLTGHIDIYDARDLLEAWKAEPGNAGGKCKHPNCRPCAPHQTTQSYKLIIYPTFLRSKSSSTRERNKSTES